MFKEHYIESVMSDVLFRTRMKYYRVILFVDNDTIMIISNQQTCSKINTNLLWKKYKIFLVPIDFMQIND